MRTRLARSRIRRRNRMKQLIKNLIIFLSLSGILLFIYQIMNRGLGSKYDELGLVLFVGIFILIITTKEE